MSQKISGKRLFWLRLIWITLALLLISLQIAGQVVTLKGQTVHLTPAQIQDLEALGLSITSFEFFRFLFVLPVPIMWSAAGLLIFWKKSDDFGALVISALAVGLGTASSIPTWKAFASAYPQFVYIVPIVAFISNICLFSFFFVFPTGHYAPRWTIILAIVLSGFNILNSYTFALPPFGIVLAERVSGLFPIFMVTALVSIFLAPIYRYRNLSTPVEREQIKWVVFAIATAIIIFAATALTVFLIPNSVPDENISFVTVFVQPIGWAVPFALIPVAIAVSILRYHLFDIDVIIRKTLVYSLLTTVLALVFFGFVIVLQPVLSSLTNSENSPLAIVLSTLAIAALFNPLRRSLQNFIDRRFYRKKYNMDQTLAKLAHHVQNETDLGQLANTLLNTLSSTIEPEFISLWITTEKDNE